MSFVQRLTGGHHRSQKKKYSVTHQPLKIERQEKRAEKQQIKLQEFQKHHSDIKDMLKMLNHNKESSFKGSTEKSHSKYKSEGYHKNTVMIPKKQCIRQEIRLKDSKPNTSAMIKFRKASDEIDKKGSDNFYFLKIQKENANKITFKSEGAQNPQSPEKNTFRFKTKAPSENLCEKRGLQNIGNTCYINAVLQCLFHFSHFSEELREVLNHLTQNQQANAIAIKKYLDLYDGIINQKGTADLSTLPLKRSISKICSMFIDFEQEDAHEFLRQMLDTMHKQLNLVQAPPQYRTFSFSLLTENMATVVQEYQKFLKRYDDSFIYDAFCGQMCSFVSCSNCEKSSLALENFLDLSLSLIKGVHSLQGLITEYFECDTLWDFYSCGACKTKVKNSVKKIDLWDPPNHLILQLKRSQFGKKNDSKITIPTKTLNMKRFMKTRTEKVQKSGSYRLMGVTHHRGAGDGGHYWALVRSSNHWYIIDDLNTKKCEPSIVERQLQVEGSSTAYLLFYELI